MNETQKGTTELGGYFSLTYENATSSAIPYDSTAVDMNSPGKDIQWTRNQHKNTFVLARHNLISPANRWGNRNRFGNDWRNFIPRGIITVKFFADPCDVIDSTESGYDGVQDPASGDFEL